MKALTCFSLYSEPTLATSSLSCHTDDIVCVCLDTSSQVPPMPLCNVTGLLMCPCVLASRIPVLSVIIHPQCLVVNLSLLHKITPKQQPSFHKPHRRRQVGIKGEGPDGLGLCWPTENRDSRKQLVSSKKTIIFFKFSPVSIDIYSFLHICENGDTRLSFSVNFYKYP